MQNAQEIADRDLACGSHGDPRRQARTGCEEELRHVAFAEVVALPALSLSHRKFSCGYSEACLSSQRAVLPNTGFTALVASVLAYCALGFVCAAMRNRQRQVPSVHHSSVVLLRLQRSESLHEGGDTSHEQATTPRQRDCACRSASSAISRFSHSGIKWRCSA